MVFIPIAKAILVVCHIIMASQICHCCGAVHPEMKDLSVRVMDYFCGYKIDRDHNAAKNIKSEGLRLLTA